MIPLVPFRPMFATARCCGRVVTRNTIVHLLRWIVFSGFHVASAITLFAGASRYASSGCSISALNSFMVTQGVFSLIAAAAHSLQTYAFVSGDENRGVKVAKAAAGAGAFPLGVLIWGSVLTLGSNRWSLYRRGDPALQCDPTVYSCAAIVVIIMWTQFLFVCPLSFAEAMIDARLGARDAPDRPGVVVQNVVAGVGGANIVVVQPNTTDATINSTDAERAAAEAQRAREEKARKVAETERRDAAEAAAAAAALQSSVANTTRVDVSGPTASSSPASLTHLHEILKNFANASSEQENTNSEGKILAILAGIEESFAASLPSLLAPNGGGEGGIEQVRSDGIAAGSSAHTRLPAHIWTPAVATRYGHLLGVIRTAAVRPAAIRSTAVVLLPPPPPPNILFAPAAAVSVAGLPPPPALHTAK